MLIPKLAQKFLLLSAILGLSFSLSPSEASAQSVAKIQFTQNCCNLVPTFALNTFPFAGGGGGVAVRTTGDVNGGLSPKFIPVAVGAGPGYSLSFAQSTFGYSGNFTGMQPLPVPAWITIATMVNFKNEAGVMQVGGQTGTRSYCINYTGNPNCTDPAKGTFNGRLAFKAGTNNFGGTMRILGGTPGFLRRTDGGPLVERVGAFQAPLSQIGGPFAEYKSETNTAVFYTALNPTIPTRTEKQQIVFAGIQWGTGKVYGAGTGGTGRFPTQSFSNSGSDARVGGLGNISLVAASMVGGSATNTFPVAATLTMTVPEPGSIAMLVGGMAGIVLLARRGRRA